MKKEFQLILNPVSGNGKGAKAKAAILKALELFNIGCVVNETQCSGHAKTLVVDLIKSGEREFIIAGGDGTINEVINGILSQCICPTTDISIGLVPIGTGNDLRRTHNIEHNILSAAETISKKKFIVQDAGKIIYRIDNAEHNRYFANIAGAGFDAAVVKSVKESKLKLGKAGYFLSILKVLFTHNCTKTVIVSGIIEKNYNVLSMNIGVAKYSGGGMKFLPDAIVDDGLLDVLIIRKASPLKIIASLPKLFNGSIKMLKECEYFQTSKIEVSASTPLMIEADGEYLGLSGFKIEVIPKCLKIYSNL